MQVVTAIPRSEELQRYGGAEEALLRDVSGIPLLIRVLATNVTWIVALCLSYRFLRPQKQSAGAAEVTKAAEVNS